MQPTETRNETALERVATIIQACRRGDFTPYEAAERAIAALGLAIEAPSPLPPPPCKPVGEGEAAGQPSPLPPPSTPALVTLSTLSGLIHLHRGDLIRFRTGNGSRVMLLREAPVIAGERRLCGFGDDGVNYTASICAVLGVCRDRETWERIQPTEDQPRPGTIKPCVPDAPSPEFIATQEAILAHAQGIASPDSRPANVARAPFVGIDPGSASGDYHAEAVIERSAEGTRVVARAESKPALLLAVSRALVRAVRDSQASGRAFRDHGGDTIETAPEWAAFNATVGEAETALPGGTALARLGIQAKDVVAIVEGPHAPRWAAGGLRLKDTREWCAFYCAVKAAEREVATPDPKPAPAPDKGEESDGYHTFNELYEHRHALFMALAACVPAPGAAWMSRLHDDGSSMPGWFIAGIDLPRGKTITYHLPERLWGEAWESNHFNVLKRAPKWDGHTSADVVKRLHEWIAP